jgi:hypothetical protein
MDYFVKLGLTDSHLLFKTSDGLGPKYTSSIQVKPISFNNTNSKRTKKKKKIDSARFPFLKECKSKTRRILVLKANHPAERSGAQ